MEFSDQILAFRNKVEELSRRTHAKTTTILQKRIIKDTPIKTGRLRANWHATVGETPPTIGIWNGSNNYKADILRAIKSGELELESLGIDDTSYITNNCDYAWDMEFLEPGDGGSNQAPNGMVRINITPPIFNMVVQQAINESTRELGVTTVKQKRYIK